MANDPSNGKHPRFFTAEEAREKFLAARAKALAGEPIDADDSTVWHEVDNPLTSQRRKLITDEFIETTASISGTRGTSD